MGNLSHTVGGTDNLVSFKSAARVPIDSLKVHFKPIQEGEGDPSPENIRPIRGWNAVKAYKSGKNIARVTGYNAVNSSNADEHANTSNKYGTTINTNNYNLPDSSVIITQTQAPNEASPQSYNNGYFAVMVKNLIYGNYYDVSFKITDVTNNILNCNLNNIVVLVPNGSMYSVSEIKDNVFIYKNIQWKRNNSIPNRSNFEIRNCGMSFTLSEFMVTPAGINDGVFEPYCGEVIPVTFPPEAGTIYGGYVDLAKGEVVQEYDIYTFTGDKKDGFIYTYTSSLSNDEVSERHSFNTTILDNIAKRNSTLDAYCNIGAPNQYSLGRKGSIIYYVGTPSKQVSLSIDSSLCEPTIESFSQWLSEHPLQLVYKLANPVTYSLAPAQLAAFINVNNIWSNTNDVTEVSYAVHDTAPIRAARKRILTASPHIESVSSDLITFNTDVVAPLKECKIYFEPVQEGEGDPSPENIRPIKGWNSLEVTKCGKNIAHIIGYSAQSTNSLDQIFTLTNKYGTTINNTQPEKSVEIIQSQWPNSDQIYSFNNGYFTVIVDNLQYGSYYDVSFKISDISNNPLNATLSSVRLAPPNGRGYAISDMLGDTIIFKNVLYGRHTSSVNRIGFSIYNCGMSCTLSEFMVTPAGMNDGVFEPHNNITISITFPAEAGTIYGGYVDLINGEIVQEYELVEDTWGNIKHSSVNSTTGYQYGRLFFKNPVVKAGMSGVKNVSYCNVGAYVWDLTSNATPHFYIDTMGNTETTYIAYITLPSTTDDNLLITCAAKLINPITYPLNSQTLKTLRGVNNIWSNSNGPISIKYWKH